MSTQLDQMNRTKSLLCIVPPYRYLNCPPAGAAALLGHLKGIGHQDIQFLDLRLYAPHVYCPTFETVGIFGQSFVMDIPDLPLVLSVINAFEEHHEGPTYWRELETYAYERGLHPQVLNNYLVGMEQFVTDAFSGLPELEFVGFSVWSSNLTTTLLAAKHLKNRKHPPHIIAGGPQVTESTASASLAIRAGLFDAVVQGEGEAALATLYQWFLDGKPLQGAPGTRFLDSDGNEQQSNSGPLLRINQLSTPDFDKMALECYRSTTGQLKLPFQLSRGCTDKCSFCSEWVFWKHFRPDDARHAIAQLQELQFRYNIDAFHFTDSLLNGHSDRLRTFCEALLTKNVKISWGGFMRADMDRTTAALLRRSGFSYAYIGLESLSDETLALMNKRRTAAASIASVLAFLEEGIPVSVGVIPGFPGDTRRRFLGTVQALAEITSDYPNLFSINVEPFVASPEQPLYRDLSSVGLVGIPWPDSVLDIAAKYRDISERILCEVKGANQGTERSGQLRLLHLIVTGSHIDSKTSVSNRTEDIPPDRVRIVPVRGMHLVTANYRGRVIGTLMTEGERHRCTEHVQSGHVTLPLFSRESFVSFWADVEAEQAWSSQRDNYPVIRADLTSDECKLYIPPYVIGREYEDEDSTQKIIVVNILTATSLACNRILSPLLEFLSTSPRPCEEVLAKMSSIGIPGPLERSVITSMYELGLMVHVAQWRNYCHDGGTNLFQGGLGVSSTTPNTPEI